MTGKQFGLLGVVAAAMGLFLAACGGIVQVATPTAVPTAKPPLEAGVDDASVAEAVEDGLQPLEATATPSPVPTPTVRGRVKAVTIPTPTPTLTPAPTATMRPPDTYPFPIQLIDLRVLSAACRLSPEVPSFAVPINVVAVRTTAENSSGGIDPVALLTVMTADGSRNFETTVDPAFANALREIRFGTLPWERSKRIDPRFEYKMIGDQFQYLWVKEIADHDGELLCKLDFRADPYFDGDRQLAYRRELGSIVLAVE